MSKLSEEQTQVVLSDAMQGAVNVKVCEPGQEAREHPDLPKCETCKGSGVVPDNTYGGWLKLCDHCYGSGVK